VIEPALALLQFGFEAAAKHHVQFLKAAADAEQRNAAVDDGADELQGHGVARMVVGLMVGGGLFAVVRRVHVGDGAGHQDAVEGIEQVIEMDRVDHGGNHQRRAF